MFAHDHVFAIAKSRQQDFEADAAARRLVQKTAQKPAAGPERRRVWLSVRVRHA